ncbi:dihydrolipoamide acetyltransferase component of pyruvate dehydrogenase complex [Desulfuromonas versatilis]|uniref:Dihydrolipoamide acetyltransferase component of pyruvate dehydrogenase complex n=1 Tax=Desulfuromonas versatilis TaxID=2802975 RepID=A0ABM8HUE2_9BACT|nr:dihydrolipoamide acetyltransferase family protein [Desulfuromonas versatilis]BCR04105.1 dihydrolipoamide acetyltransferase component of pyruvate dehydrogenase complex [Desulfuromonas versatilis]
MAVEVTMPKLSDTMVEGTILNWRIKEGDRVAKGDIIADIRAEDAAMVLEAVEDGVVAALRVDAGESVRVGWVIAVFAGTGSVPQVAQGRTARPRGADLDKVGVRSPAGRRALGGVEGNALDLAGAAAGRTPESGPGTAEPRKAEKAVRIRRILARKMVESWQSIPHFFVTIAVDMTDVIKFRKDLKVSVNDFVLAAVARSLQEHPWVNSLWMEGEAVEQKTINLAMAVASERGLYSPVLKDCGQLSLKEISRRAADLAARSHLGQLRQDDLEGGTFTVSNMGMLGVESFSAIITPPQAAVLAVGTIKGEVVVDDNGEPGIAPMLRLTLSADHRILDGADAAEFLATLKSYLEAPVTLVTCNYGTEGN